MSETPSTEVLDAVNHDLKLICAKVPSLLKGALAATARTMARELDSNNSATSKSMCAKQLRETLAEIKALVPEEAPQDSVSRLLADIR